MSVELGKRNMLQVLRDSPHGVFLEAGSWGEVLLPRRYVSEGLEVGRSVDVFLYRDSEDRVVATTEEPYAYVGEFGLFEVVGWTPGVGAFLDWGLPKDLLLPLREQARRLQVGEWVIAAVILDERSQRIVASTKLNRHMNRVVPEYVEGQMVRMLLAERTELGVKAIVENAHWGLLYASEMSGEWEIGQWLDGYVRRVRSDGKLDLGLDPTGYERVGPLCLQIVAALQAAGGRMPYTDKSSPEVIRATFATSKKAFKQALGALLKDGRIRFVEDGIALCEDA